MEKTTVDANGMSAATIASELLPILSMWGLSRDTARRAASMLATRLAGMTDKEYEATRAGTRIKTVTSEEAARTNDNANH